MKKVLIVDDNLDLCRPMVALLKYLGFESQYATGGEQALGVISDSHPDLVILDVMMPDMDGLEVLRRIKNDQQKQDVKVVMFSAVADSELRTHALSKGAADYWIKANLDFSELGTRINKILDLPN